MAGKYEGKTCATPLCVVPVMQVGCAEFMLAITLLCAQESGKQLEAVHAFNSGIHSIFLGKDLLSIVLASVYSVLLLSMLCVLGFS